MKKLTYFALVCLGAMGCTDEDPVLSAKEYYTAIQPTTTRGLVSNIRQTRADYQLYLQKGGSLGIQKYGVCYSTGPAPTLRDTHEFFAEKIDTIPFVLNKRINGLTLGTRYVLRNFLITSRDTLYGEPYPFMTVGSNDFASYESTKNPFSFSKEKLVSRETDGYFSYKNQLYAFGSKDQLLDAFDPIKEEWRSVSAIPTKLLAGSIGNTPYTVNKRAFLIGDEAYVLLYSLTEKKWEFWQFDLKINNWKQLATPPLFSRDLISVNNFFTDGRNGFYVNSNETWKYDASIQVWQKIFEFAGNKIFNGVYTDGVATYLSADFELYKFDTQNNSWKSLLNIEGFLASYGGTVGKDDRVHGWVKNGKLILSYSGGIPLALHLFEIDPNSGSVKKITTSPSFSGSYDFLQTDMVLYALGPGIFAQYFD